MGNKIKLVIGVALVVVVAMFVVALLSLGGDDEPQSAGDDAGKTTAKSGGDSGGSGSGSASEPALKTVAVKRSEGANAAVNVGSLIRKPGEVWLRVSSAPKQKVTVNWTLACGVGATAQGDYVATPPDTRQLKLPKKSPKTCVASASSQIDGNGRLKLAILRDR